MWLLLTTTYESVRTPDIEDETNALDAGFEHYPFFNGRLGHGHSTFAA